MPRRSFEAIARETAKTLGVTIDECSTTGFISLSTEPRTSHFTATGCHFAVTPYEDGDTNAQMWKSVIDDLRYGVSKCENKNCECLLPGTGYGN